MRIKVKFSPQSLSLPDVHRMEKRQARDYDRDSISMQVSAHPGPCYLSLRHRAGQGETDPQLHANPSQFKPKTNLQQLVTGPEDLRLKSQAGTPPRLAPTA